MSRNDILILITNNEEVTRKIIKESDLDNELKNDYLEYLDLALKFIKSPNHTNQLKLKEKFNKSEKFRFYIFIANNINEYKLPKITKTNLVFDSIFDRKSQNNFLSFQSKTIKEDFFYLIENIKLDDDFCYITRIKIIDDIKPLLKLLFDDNGIKDLSKSKNFFKFLFKDIKYSDVVEKRELGYDRTFLYLYIIDEICKSLEISCDIIADMFDEFEAKGHHRLFMDKLMDYNKNDEFNKFLDPKIIKTIVETFDFYTIIDIYKEHCYQLNEYRIFKFFCQLMVEYKNLSLYDKEFLLPFYSKFHKSRIEILFKYKLIDELDMYFILI